MNLRRIRRQAIWQNNNSPPSKQGGNHFSRIYSTEVSYNKGKIWNCQKHPETVQLDEKAQWSPNPIQSRHISNSKMAQRLEWNLFWNWKPCFSKRVECKYGPEDTMPNCLHIFHPVRGVSQNCSLLLHCLSHPQTNHHPRKQKL